MSEGRVGDNKLRRLCSGAMSGNHHQRQLPGGTRRHLEALHSNRWRFRLLRKVWLAKEILCWEPNAARGNMSSPSWIFGLVVRVCMCKCVCACLYGCVLCMGMCVFEVGCVPFCVCPYGFALVALPYRFLPRNQPNTYVNTHVHAHVHT